MPYLDFSKRIFLKAKTGTSPIVYIAPEDCFCFIHTDGGGYGEKILINGNYVAHLAEDNISFPISKGDEIYGASLADQPNSYNYCFAYKK